MTEGQIVWAERNIAADGMTGDVHVELAAGAPAVLSGHLRSGKLTQADLPTVALALDFDYRPDAAKFSLSAVDPGNSFVAKIDADVANPQSAPLAKLHADLSFDETAPVWSLTGLPAPTTGRTEIGAEIELPLPPLGEIASLSLPPELSAKLNVDLQGLAWPGFVSSLTGTGRILLARAADRYTLTSLGPVAVRGVLDPAQRAKLTLPAGIADKIEGRLVATVADGSSVVVTMGEAGPAIAGNGAIRINNPTDLLISARGQFTADPGPHLAQFVVEHGEIWTTHWSLDPTDIHAAAINSLLIKGSAVGTPEQVSGHAHLFAVGLSVEAGGAFAKKAQGNVEVDYALDPAKFTASLTEPGTIAADGLVLPGLRSETQSVILAVRPADTPLIEADLAAADGPLVRHAVKLDGFAMTVQPEGAGGANGPISFAAQSASLAGQWSPAAGWQGQLAVYGGRALLPEKQIAAEGIEARMRLGAGAHGKIELHVGALSLGPGGGAVPKLTVDGTAELTGNSVEFDLTAADPRKIIAFAASGTHDLHTGNGAGQIQVAPIHFSPGGLQPRDLLPELGNQIDEATGVVSLAGSLAWKTGAVFGDATLRHRGPVARRSRFRRGPHERRDRAAEFFAAPLPPGPADRGRLDRSRPAAHRRARDLHARARPAARDQVGRAAHGRRHRRYRAGDARSGRARRRPPAACPQRRSRAAVRARRREGADRHRPARRRDPGHHPGRPGDDRRCAARRAGARPPRLRARRAAARVARRHRNH